MDGGSIPPISTICDAGHITRYWFVIARIFTPSPHRTQVVISLLTRSLAQATGREERPGRKELLPGRSLRRERFLEQRADVEPRWQQHGSYDVNNTV